MKYQVLNITEETLDKRFRVEELSKLIKELSEGTVFRTIYCKDEEEYESYLTDFIALVDIELNIKLEKGTSSFKIYESVIDFVLAEKCSNEEQKAKDALQLAAFLGDQTIHIQCDTPQEKTVIMDYILNSLYLIPEIGLNLSIDGTVLTVSGSRQFKVALQVRKNNFTVRVYNQLYDMLDKIENTIYLNIPSKAKMNSVIKDIIEHGVKFRGLQPSVENFKVAGRELYIRGKRVKIVPRS